MENPHNILADLQLQAARHPEATALVHQGHAYSFAELNTATDCAAQWLHQQGIQAGDVVVAVFKSELLYALVILANAALGATTLCLPDTTTALQRVAFCRQARANRFLTDRPLNDGPDLPWQQVSASALLAQPAHRPSEAQLAPRAPQPTAPLLLAIGSGSTGEKKLMAISHQAMHARCTLVMDDPVLQPGTRLLCLSSLAFISVANRMFNAIRAGITFVLLDDSARENIFRFIERQQVSALIVSVFHLEAMLRQVQAQTPDTTWLRTRVRAIRCVGSLLSEDLKRRVHEQLNQNIINSYATNESGVVCRTSLPATFTGQPDVGLPLAGMTVQIVSPQGQVLPAGQRGLVRMRSPGLIDGYLYNEPATERAFRDGWFYPGDVGEMTPDGRLLFHGRADRMMIFNGINIFPSEIELALTAHPAVADCVAFPIKDPVSQDIPTCAVALKPGCTAQEPELIKHAFDRLGVSYPRRVFVLAHMPKTVEGKIDLGQVVAMVRAQMAS